jgi:spore coat-associated protein N
MKKRILTSVLVIGLVAALAGTGTWALYTDTAASTGNTITGGTLDLKADGSDTVAPMSFSAVGPGDWGWAYNNKFYALTNTGSVRGGKLTYRIDNVQNSGGVLTPPEAAVDPDNHGDLGDNTVVTVWFPDWDTKVGDFTLAQLKDGITITNDFEGAVPSSGPKGVEFDANIPASADNKIQGDSVVFDGHLTLEQSTN